MEITKAVKTDWDYDSSVKKVKLYYPKWKSMSVELLRELHLARFNLRAQGKRTDLNLLQNKRKLTWEGFCKETGLVYSTVQNWLTYYDPKTNEMIEKKDSKRIKAAPIKLDLNQMPISYRKKPRNFRPEHLEKLSIVLGEETAEHIRQGIIDCQDLSMEYLSSDKPENIKSTVSRKKALAEDKLKKYLKSQKEKREQEERMKSMFKKDAEDREYLQQKKLEEEAIQEKKAARAEKEKKTLYLHISEYDKPPELRNLFTSMVLDIDKLCKDIQYLVNHGQDIESVKYIFRDKEIINKYIEGLKEE